MRIGLFLISLQLILSPGCFLHSQPTHTSQPNVPSDADICAGQARQLEGTYCKNPPDPLPPSYAESVRRGYEGLKPRCSEAALESLASCVKVLEDRYASLDPDAAKRRDAARPGAETTRSDKKFKAYIDRWMQNLDELKIICRQRKVSESHQRKCNRAKVDLQNVEKKLAAYLENQGFDRRDFSELGLWPRDPNPYD